MLAGNEEKAVMRQLRLHRPVPVVLVACVAIGLGGMTSARADIISSSPSLPVLGVPYTSAVGAGCFPLAGFCVTAGSLTLTSLVSSTFDLTGQDIITDASYSGELTNLSSVPIAPVNLTGMIEQEVVGRTSNTETGTWVTDITSLSLSGTVEGFTLDLTLDTDSAVPSAGSTSVTSLGNGGGQQNLSYDISSFFDVFVDLTYHTPTPLHATREITGEIGVPEPASLVLLAAPLLALAAARRRRRG
jgi:hypothetical protein